MIVLNSESSCPESGGLVHQNLHRGEVKNDITYFFYPNPNHYAVHDLPDNEVSHIIHIRGDVERKLLYAYVELFNMQNVLIKLNMDYRGPEINDTYAFDLMSGEAIKKNITIKLTKPHFEILHLISQANRNQIDERYRRLELIIENNQMGRRYIRHFNDNPTTVNRRNPIEY